MRHAPIPPDSKPAQIGLAVVRAADIVIVPANTPHTLASQGDAPLRQIAIHVTSKMEPIELE